MPRKIIKDGLSLEEMRKQLRMHEEALVDVEERDRNSKRWYDHIHYKYAAEYHRHRIENYKCMIKKEEQQ